ncbi:MAG: hypothetical protein LQ338_001463 [Usnochroma carphineum]|nr:MAG: hypothetical protein LQ338_001463 [Usnochroma carphineum]
MAASDDFNWLYLLWLLICAILSIFFLFYFNRVFASLVSYGIRTYVWRQYHVYIDIQALQFSLLGGRCFFKGFRYHGHNETVLINDGYITWRYWLRRVKDAELFSTASASSQQGREEELGQNHCAHPGKNRSGHSLPCRLKLRARGIEWFIYNRTPSYEAIEKGLSANEQLGSPTSASQKRESGYRTQSYEAEKNDTRSHSSNGEFTPSTAAGEKETQKDPGEDGSIPKSFTASVDSLARNGNQETSAKVESLPAFLMFLPLKIECSKGAIVMGNRSTRSVLTAKFDAVTGHVDAHQTRTVDVYKQMFEFDFGHPVIEMRPNHEFSKSQSHEDVKREPTEHQPAPATRQRQPHGDDVRSIRAAPAVTSNLIRNCKRLAKSMSRLGLRRQTKGTMEVPKLPGQDQWLGLTRYLDDENDIALEQERWRSIEYGEQPTVVDSPSISMTLHWDVPGIVREPMSNEDAFGDADDINGDIPPDWAVELQVKGGLLSYGPWADRLRQDLQQMFFPNTFRDAVPAKPLSPGQARTSTVFKLSVVIEKTTTLMIPTREPSKDWKWKEERGAKRNASKDERASKSSSKKQAKEKANALSPGRPYGWLDLEIQPDSTMTFTMDLVARDIGYRNILALDIRAPKMSSSVNHGLLLNAQTAVISCDLSNPLGWCDLRQWAIAVDCSGLEVFLLRDHLFLLTDLINDWTVGPPGDYHTFVPFVYTMNFRFRGFNLHLNANDSNVINNPASAEENTFLTLWARDLSASVRIPLTCFQPSRNDIPFDISAQDCGLKLSRPPWNTQHVFVRSSEVATMEDMMIDGSYNYFSSTSTELTDALRMNVHGIAPRIRLYGFLVRAFMRLKDNYFGDDMHFRTLEEYQEQIAKDSVLSSSGNTHVQRTKLSNDLDVILSITAVTAEASLPSYIYSAAENVSLDVPSLGLDLRFTNYYMDLDVAFSPITVSHASSTPSKGEDSAEISETQLFIDGVEVKGHRLFGLPPTEPTYVCNWDFSIGDVIGECSIPFFKAFSSALRCLSFSFDDAENALQPLSTAEIHDVTFLRAHVKLLRIWLEIDDAALLVSAKDCKIEYNDWAKSFFSQRLRINLPTIAVAVVNTNGSVRDPGYQDGSLRPYAYFESAFELSMLHRKHDFDTDYRLQQHHLSLQDCRTKRTPWLISEDDKSLFFGSTNYPKITAPAMPFPAMPEPMHIPDTPNSASTSVSNLSPTSTRSAASATERRSFRSYASCKKAVDNSNPDYLQRRGKSNTSSEIPRPKASAASGRLVDISFPPRSQSPTSKTWSHPERAHGTRGSNAHKTLGASSSYKVPGFRLQSVSLDLAEVPVLPGKSARASRGEDSQRASSDTDRAEFPKGQPKCERKSLFVDLGQGARALCRPQCLSILASAFKQLQIEEPVSILDKLQIDVLEGLPSIKEKSHRHEKITEARVDIPCLHLRIIDEAQGNSGATAQDMSGDLTIGGCIITSQHWDKSSSGAEDERSNTLSIHVLLDRAALSAKIFDRHSKQDNANLRLILQDTNLWGLKAAESTTHVQFKDLHIQSAVDKPGSLPLLVKSGKRLAQSARRFQDILRQQSVRVRHFVLSLASKGQELPDPPFLTRASYVLRVANSRLRASESWKIISRLRYVYHMLPPQSRAEIESQCSSPSQRCPDSAREEVVAIFGRLGMWDGRDVRGSVLLKEIFGKRVDRALQSAAGWTLKMSIKAGAVLSVLHHGKSQSQVHFESIAFESLLRQLPSAAADSSAKILASIQLYCSKTTVTMDFGILELLQSLMLVFPQAITEKAPTPRKEGSGMVLAESYRLHFVLVSDVNTLALDSPSLRVLYLCRPLISSVVVGKPLDQSRRSTNFLVCTDLASIEVLSRSRVVAVGKVDRPSVFGNLDGETSQSAPSSWHLATSCTDISLKVLEDPLSLFEIVDRVLLNEVVSVNRMLNNKNSSSSASRPGASDPFEIALGRPHVAFFLDSYLISYKVLSALSYRVTGRIGRISVRPGSRHVSDVVLDFDLQEHAHAFLGRVGNGFEMISELVIPPINGRLIMDTGPSQKDVSFQSTIEHISLDAAAVHALLATLNHPEVVELVSSIQHESSRLTQRYKPKAQTSISAPSSTPSSQPFLFDVSITLVGLGIYTKTAMGSKKKLVSQLHFELGHVHAKGNNRETSDGRSRKFPELIIYLRGLQMGFTRLIEGQKRPCGDFTIGMTLEATSKPSTRQELVRAYQLRSSRCVTNIYTETASVMLDVLDELRESFKDIDLTHEVRGLQKLRRATLADLERSVPNKPGQVDEGQSTVLFKAIYSLELQNLRVVWRLGDSITLSPGRDAEDLVLSFTKIDLATRMDNAARLLIQDFQLQMVPTSWLPADRSPNSALLPEVVFNVAYMSTKTDRRLAFQAAGKLLDLRLTSQFILPANNLRRSIASAVNDIRAATEAAGVSSAQAGTQTQNWLKHKRLTSLLIDADFAGAVVYVQGRTVSDPQVLAVDVLHGKRVPQKGRYGQFTSDNAGSNTTLRAPGVALKIEYRDSGATNASLNAEVKVDASSNTLYPSVVPLVLEISSSVKEVVGEPVPRTTTIDHRPSSASRLMADGRFRTADPSAIFGNCILNLGLRICRQDFSLSCQPIARVATTAQIDNIYVTANTIRLGDHGQSLALSGAFSGLEASVQHVYSRESTGGLEVQSIAVSLMNSKHLGAANGISVITKISPMKVFVNVKQLQDFLLFREIWLPADIRKAPPARAPSPSSESHAYIVQRYQQISAASAFPWHATLSIAKLDYQLDLGQSLGKTGFVVSDMWVSSKKASNWEQNLCVGMGSISLDSTGRMSGFLTVHGVAVRTSIRWPITERVTAQVPLIQASVELDSVRFKAAFEYQAFAMADMAGFKFLMYNVRDVRTGHSDRLVGFANISALRAFCTTTSASQGLALFQAFERLIQEKQTAYQASLKEIEKSLRRRSTVNPHVFQNAVAQAESREVSSTKGALKLQTKVMVSVGTVNVGVFPSTFVDTQIFRLEALDTSAHFAVALENSRLHSTLSLALGQLQVALSGVTKPEGRKSVGEVSLEDVMASASHARGGTILKVPKVVATMQTWQAPASNDIEYIFKSAFQGKVDVGWNYSRIAFLRGMWNNHVRALAARLGKPLPQSALQITTALDEDGKDGGREARGGREKITAVVNVPQSKYQYTPLELPVIETPQLRDMGEATPPLEWIGLHRERLPNLTHQIVIVPLLEVAREVDDAYSRILGSS